MKAYGKVWREANKDKIRIYGKAWREANPQKVKEYEKARDYSTRNYLKKAQFYKDQKGICALCKEPHYIEDMDLDHIEPTSKGGADIDTNKQLLCSHCNSAIKIDKPMTDAIKYLETHIPVYTEHKLQSYIKQEGICPLCKKRKHIKLYDLDHIQAKSKGGSNEADNLEPICHHCNIIKGNRIPTEVNKLIELHKQIQEVFYIENDCIEYKHNADAYHNQWWLNNKDSLWCDNIANHTIHSDKIKAHQKVYQKAWRETNKSKIKAWREANKDKIRIYGKAWREANKKKPHSPPDMITLDMYV